MTHAHNLAALQNAAALVRDGYSFAEFGVSRNGVHAREALSHGASAVRAIRRTFDPHYSAYDENAYSIEESRLAFRAACEAVGILPDGNGHHNL